MGKPEYFDSDRKALIELARMKGMSDGQIFRKVIAGVLGAENRKRIIIQWGELMGLEANEALRTAQRAGLVLTNRLPRTLLQEIQPFGKGQGKPF
jgi:hypothetical protein